MPAGRGDAPSGSKPMSSSIDGDDRRSGIAANQSSRRGARARRGHAGAQLAIVAELFHPLGQGRRRRGGRQGSLRRHRGPPSQRSAVTTLGKPHASASYVTTAEPSNSDGNTNTSAGGHPRGILGMGNSPQRLDHFEVGASGPGLPASGPGAGAASPAGGSVPCFQQVLDALALA